MLPLNEYLNIFFTLLAIVDPLGAIPIFLILAPAHSAQLAKQVAGMASLTVCLVLIVACLFGELLLRLLGISIDSFRVAGGILLLLLALPMLQATDRLFAERSRSVRANSEKANLAVVPLAIPLLAGPGAISSMTIYAHRSLEYSHLLILIGISTLVALITGLTLLLALPIGKLLGKTGINITVRLMGLILSAAAVQFIANGLIALFPGLAH